MSASNTTNRRRAREDDDGENKLEQLLEASENYVPYVPLKQRLKGGQAPKLAPSKSNHADHAEKDDDMGAVSLPPSDDEIEEKKPDEESAAKQAKLSLLDVKEEMRKKMETMDARTLKLNAQKQAELRILGEVSRFPAFLIFILTLYCWMIIPS